jgi:hypothetical protein
MSSFFSCPKSLISMGGFFLDLLGLGILCLIGGFPSFLLSLYPFSLLILLEDFWGD